MLIKFWERRNDLTCLEIIIVNYFNLIWIKVKGLLNFFFHDYLLVITRLDKLKILKLNIHIWNLNYGIVISLKYVVKMKYF